MMKRMFTNVRVIILLVALLLALIAISPRLGSDGVAIRHVAPDSAAAFAGIEKPSSSLKPTARERILSVQGQDITDVKQFHDMIEGYTINDTILITTNEQTYELTIVPEYNITVLPELENVTVEREVNGTLTNVTLERNKTTSTLLGPQDIGLRVSEPSVNNLRKGLDLQGGTRVLLRPETPLTEAEYGILKTTLEQRLNIYGLSDIRVAVVYNVPQQLGGEPEYVMVEIAGANIEEVRDLLARQGKFEALIANETVFTGGNRDIVYIGKTATESGIIPGSCGLVSEGQYGCQFFFAITLSADAADKMAAVTAGIPLDPVDTGYLLHDIELYLDDSLVNSLRISSDLKGRSVTDIQISGSGMGESLEQARENSALEMRQLQSVLETGSLPVKLEVAKADTISPALGNAFVNNAIVVGLLAMLGVSIVVYLRYRKVSILVPMAVTIVSEVLLLLGVAALINWNLDLAAIAGIIIVVGSSVDHQIVIIDETIRGSQENWKTKLKKAFAIIFGAYMTTVVAMVPLLFAGAGLLKGFALTTIIGVTVGVFLTRPAFAAVIEIMQK